MEKFFKYGSAEAIPYYNCSVEASTAAYSGPPNIKLGVMFLTYGLVTETLYSFSILAMLTSELVKIPCYKIMILLGLFDMINISVNSITTGFLTIVGGTYCGYPNFIYIMGCLGLGVWGGACLTCLVLVLNRCAEIMKSRNFKEAFEGNYIWIWLVSPVIYWLFLSGFTAPVLFDARLGMWIFDPLVSKSYESQTYLNISHAINNILVTVSIGFMYIVLCLIFLRRFGQEISKKQVSMIVQSLLICTPTLVASFLYVFLQWIAAPAFLSDLGQITWSLADGVPAYIYLILNRSIQKEVKKMLGFRSAATGTTTTNSTKGASSAVEGENK